MKATITFNQSETEKREPITLDCESANELDRKLPNRLFLLPFPSSKNWFFLMNAGSNVGTVEITN